MTKVFIMSFFERCGNITCLRDDYVICPLESLLYFIKNITTKNYCFLENNNKLCHEILHVNGIIKKCSDFRCFSIDHIKCPTCGTDFHIIIKNQKSK